MHIEVQNAKWLDLFNTSIIAPDKQIAFSNFDESNDQLAIREHIDFVVRVEELHA